MEDIPDRALLGRGFVFGDEFGRDGRAELERLVVLVVDRGDVEGVEEVGELVGGGGAEGGAQVGDGVEHGLDLVWAGAVWPLCVECADGLVDGGASCAEFLDALGGECDDRVAGVVVFLQSEGLAVERAVDVVALEAQACEVGVVLAPAVGDRLGEFVAQQQQAVGSEQAAAHELDERFDDALLLDLQGRWVAGDRGGDGAAVGLKAAAVPVCVALMGALHPPAAERAAHASAQDVQAPVATGAALRVGGGRILEAGLVAARAVFDGVKELLGDDRLVHRHRAPHPLLTRALKRPTWALVVPAPHVVARVLGVAQHRLQL